MYTFWLFLWVVISSLKKFYSRHELDHSLGMKIRCPPVPLLLESASAQGRTSRGNGLVDCCSCPWEPRPFHEMRLVRCRLRCTIDGPLRSHPKPGIDTQLSHARTPKIFLKINQTEVCPAFIRAPVTMSSAFYRSFFARSSILFQPRRRPRGKKNIKLGTNVWRQVTQTRILDAADACRRVGLTTLGTHATVDLLPTSRDIHPRQLVSNHANYLTQLCSFSLTSSTSLRRALIELSRSSHSPNSRPESPFQERIATDVKLPTVRTGHNTSSSTQSHRGYFLCKWLPSVPMWEQVPVCASKYGLCESQTMI